MKLDQFFTKQEVADFCVSKLLALPEIVECKTFLEPSAGAGNFVDALQKYNRSCEAIDLEPQRSDIQKQDFFCYDGFADAVIGNPPFGKRSKQAIKFFWKASEFAKVIAFIVPVQWKKWSVQSKLPKEWSLIEDVLLDEESFYLPNRKPYKVRCCFQIWIKGTHKQDNRLSAKPETSHPDFEMFLYNNTKQAEKFFYYEWDVAVPRQGYADYSRRETKKECCEKTTQWMFFKAKNKKILKELYAFDFEKLSTKNLITPGWGKADFVEEWKNRK